MERDSMRDDALIPISEIFASPQGEGVFSGQMQVFVRTAGCTVGKPYPKERYEKLPHCEFKCEGGDPDIGHGPKCKYAKSTHALPIYTEKCTFADGREFACDTDYRVKERHSIRQLLAEIKSFHVNDVCFTGGEPLMHQYKLAKVMTELKNSGHIVHLETSGTIQMDESLDAFWVTVSPKLNVLESMLNRANELKILIDERFSVRGLPFDLIRIASTKPVFIQPVNYEHTVNSKNLRACLELQQEFPVLRLSLQLHKVLSHYVGERIL